MVRVWLIVERVDLDEAGSLIEMPGFDQCAISFKAQGQDAP